MKKKNQHLWPHTSPPMLPQTDHRWRYTGALTDRAGSQRAVHPHTCSQALHLCPGLPWPSCSQTHTHTHTLMPATDI